ncbi:MAG TPA: DUF1214 domain-containing protein [Ornithinibacter sp.]|nr:DUF1214 domain-containing protein [Ornithinibacter sp.]
MDATMVNVDNFVRAETDRMFAATQNEAGGPNRFMHNREPAQVDNQPVIRMNRDTLYSFAIVDLAAGARLTVPDGGSRYVSVMVVNNEHHINRILHEAGEYELTEQEHGSRYVAVVARVLVDPADPADVAAVAALQDQFVLEAGSSEPFVPGGWDNKSLDATRDHLLGLAAGMTSFEHSFGRREEVDPVHHLISTAAGWGGLPDSEASYVGVFPGLPVGRYELTVGEVPVDGFWSISVYNAAGYFEPNEQGHYSVNDITATRGDDGTVTVRFGGCEEGAENCIPIPEGWNYLVRLYRPRPEALDGSWHFPSLAAHHA